MGDKILVVDDEFEIRSMLNDVLSREGYEVILASNGEEAIALAEQEDPQAILLDIVLPVIDGIEVCKRLKAEELTLTIPVIIMTELAYSKVDVIEAGADDFLAKPFDLVEVLFRLKSVLRVRYLTDEVDRLVAYLKNCRGIPPRLSGPDMGYVLVDHPRLAPGKHLTCNLNHLLIDKKGGIMEDRRTSFRMNVDWPVKITTSEDSMEGEVKNASSTGALIHCTKPLSPEEKCLLMIELPSSPALEIQAEIVWSTAAGPDDKSRPGGMGVRFLW
jgi:CheY-like chemotaxis protein